MTQMSNIEFTSLGASKQREVRKDWKKCPLDKWNATTARDYMNTLTQHRWSLPYVGTARMIENAHISKFIKEYGREALKIFIYEAWKSYVPTQDYPIPTFTFLVTYKKEHILPKVLKRMAEEQARKEALERQKTMKTQSQASFF